MIRSKIKTSLPQLHGRINSLTEECVRCLHGIDTALHAQPGPGSAADIESLLRSGAEALAEAGRECARTVRTLDKEIADLESRAFSYQKLYALGLAVSAELDLQRIMELGMESAIEIARARRGYIALVAEEGGIEFLVAKSSDVEDRPEAVYEISRTIVDQVIRTGLPVEIDDAMEHDTLRHLKSVEGFKLRSILCVPLEADRVVLGVLYLDNKESGGIFTAESTEILKAFAKQISLALKQGIAFRRISTARDALMESLRERYDFSSIVGGSEKLRHVLEIVAKVAGSVANVLVLGESGTGKELIAYSLHANSPRRDKPFVVVNAAAIPEHLLESELFGYEKGAFTGAAASKPGKFELANGGTLFLDEIGDMSVALQAKLLRAVQQRVVERLGGIKPIAVDIRIIAATNRDIPSMIARNLFREDLYYRLNVITLSLPPLRERREDVPLLVNHFLKRFSARENKTITGVSPRAMALLERYDWPGNARQLENTIERAVILCADEQITPLQLPADIAGDAPRVEEESVLFNDQVNAHKRHLIVKALQAAGNNKSEAARQLGLSRSFFYELLSELGIQ